MSCKYCTPVGGEIEPLVAWGIRMTIERSSYTKRAAIVATDGEYTTQRFIDFCPVCGESLRPFGPAWTRDLER